MIRLAHVWSSDIGLALSLHHVRHLIEQGWEVYGICPPGPRVAAIERAGVRWLPHPIERRINPRTDVAGFRSLYDTCRRYSFQIVHTHNAKVGVLARLAAAAARVPVVVHTHNGLIYSMDSRLMFRFGAASLERVASAVCDRAFVQSKDDYDCLVRTGGASERILELVGNGIDVQRFDPGRFDREERLRLRRGLGIAAEEVLFFSAGRIVSEKGFNELFEAYELARKSEPRIRLAVAGPEDAERGLGIGPRTLERARQHGALLLGERSDMEALYAASDVVVLPSWREGIARVLMEGAAMGKPLIASDARGCRRVVRPGWGLLVPVKDAVRLSEAMLELARQERLRAEIGAHNARAARDEYDLKRILARVDRAYVELLRAKGIALRPPVRLSAAA
jgi:glycosyltransferase involved in cell wall biosynthesis